MEDQEKTKEQLISELEELRQEKHERKQAEQSLSKSEKRFRAITENALEWIWEIDVNRKYTYSSTVVEKILGYRSEEVVNKHIYDFFHPENREHLKEAMFETFEKKQSFREFVNRNVHKNGKEVWLSTSGVPILDDGGNLTGYIGSNTDITERKQFENKMQKQVHDFGERVKELNCLYGISRLVETPDITFDELIQGTIVLIPPSWQYPEITCARITIEGQTFETIPFRETSWKQSSKIKIFKKQFGVLEIYYLEERPELYEGPFLREERNLIDVIAEQLGRIIERKREEEALRC